MTLSTTDLTVIATAAGFLWWAIIRVLARRLRTVRRQMEQTDRDALKSRR